MRVPYDDYGIFDLEYVCVRFITDSGSAAGYVCFIVRSGIHYRLENDSLVLISENKFSTKLKAAKIAYYSIIHLSPI